jgi:hypothetical protein
MRFLTTKDLMNGSTEELFDPNWMNSDTPIYPPYVEWDNSRPLSIEDIDIWEVINDGGFANGVYAAWLPYAEFYLVIINGKWSTFYGPGSQKAMKEYLKPYRFQLNENKVWVDDVDAPKYNEDWYVFNDGVYQAITQYQTNNLQYNIDGSFAKCCPD